MVYSFDLSNPIAVSDLLDLLSDWLYGSVGWTVRDGVVLVTVAERAHPGNVVFVHSVRDLLVDPLHFFADDQEFAPLFVPLDLDDIATLVLENVKPGSWERDGVLIDAQNGLLTVVHEPAAQAQIEEFLDHLRGFFAPLPTEGVPGQAGGHYPEIGDDTNEILETLDEVRISPKFGMDGEGAPLDDVAAFLQRVTGVNFVITTAVVDELDEEETAIYMDLPERSVRQVLNLIDILSESLSWTVKNGSVLFVVREELYGGQVLALHDVRPIVEPATWRPEGVRRDAEIEEFESMVMTADALEALIRDTISPMTWDEDPNNALRISHNGAMFVNQRPEVHAQIDQLLEHLYEVADRMGGGD